MLHSSRDDDCACNRLQAEIHAVVHHVTNHVQMQLIYLTMCISILLTNSLVLLPCYSNVS